MAGYQYTIIIGNVGQRPELRFTQSGIAVADFTVAVNRNWKDSEGNKHEDVSWFRVTAWRGLAETVNAYVTKGMQVMVTGNVSASAFVGQDGEARASLELTAQNIQFLSSKLDGSQQQSPYPANPEDMPF
jgi:single-strand DNA-binding protein